MITLVPFRFLILLILTVFLYASFGLSGLALGVAAIVLISAA